MEPQTPLDYVRRLLIFIYSVTNRLECKTEVANCQSFDPNSITIPPEGRVSLGTIYKAIILNNYGSYDNDIEVPAKAKENWWPHIWAFNDVADTCREDFEKLRNLLVQIRQANSPDTCWSTFRQALESHWYENEVLSLERRCKSSLDSLTEHVCSFSRCWVTKYQDSYSELRDANTKQRLDVPEHFRNQIGYTPQFEAMSRLITETLARIETIEARQKIVIEDAEVLISSLVALHRAERSVSGEHVIMNSLAFNDHTTQFNSIPTAVDPMFKWVFASPDGPGSPRSSSDLNRWLRQGYGIGLVVGDSGCGKSMLMKHISMHSDLDGSLYQWSNPKPVIIASHFFCKTGTPLQRSRLGMLRTLLRAVLLQMPGDIDTIYREHGVRNPERLREHMWTIEELERRLLAVLKSHKNLKFCFFIDGLDECDDDPADLVNSLQTLVRTGNGKLCVSSCREDIKDLFSVTVTRFSIGGSFLYKDLEIFLGSRLAVHPWCREKASTSERAELARATANKFRNFLWGRVAVEHLCARPGNAKTLQDMKRQLDNLPTEPVALVRHCLRATPGTLAPMAAYSFVAALTVNDPPPLAVFQYLTKEQGEPDYALKLKPEPPTAEKHVQALEKAREALYQRCGSFLQVRPDSRVGFPHAAIEKIIRADEMVVALRKKSATRNTVLLSLARAYLAYMKATKLSWGRPTYAYVYLTRPPFMKIFDEFLVIARPIDSDSRVHQLMNEWENCFERKAKLDQQQLDLADRAKVNLAQHFQKPVLEALLTGYIDYKLSKHPKFLNELRARKNETARPALSVVLKAMFAAPEDRRSEYIRMLRCLMFRHCNPNEIYQRVGSTCTPFTDLISWGLSRENFKWTMSSSIICVFLSHRANPNAPVWDRHPPVLGTPRRCYTTSWVVVWFAINQMLRQTRMIETEQDEKACLDVMEKFSRYGANANTSPSSDFFNLLQPCENTRWAKILMRDLFDGRREDLPTAHTLRAGLAQHVLAMLVKAGHDVDWSWDLLEQNLSSEVALSVKDKVLKGKGAQQASGPVVVSGSPILGKRSSDREATDSEPSPKRSRSEPGEEQKKTKTGV